MKILVTGNQGMIGAVIEKRLVGAGHAVVGFDLKAGNDIRNLAAVIKAGEGCEAVVHLAAIPGRTDGSNAEDVIRTNLLGTFDVLESARINAFRKVLFMSSVNAIGIFMGESAPDYFPIDDEHPCRPTTAYGISKKLGEEMCSAFWQTTHIPTICLRPPGVWNEQSYFNVIERRRKSPKYEWYPFWEYGAFVDVRDLADLVSHCLGSDFAGYGCYLVSSDDITTSGKTSLELAFKLYPRVKWKRPDGYAQYPFRTLVDCRNARDTFGWAPQFSWARFIGENKKGVGKQVVI